MISARHLLAQLDAFAPADSAEAGSLDRIKDLLRSAGDPFTRYNPDHVTASIVLARPDGSAFLLVAHRRLDRWLQPGGHVDSGDQSVLQTALREAREETGVTQLDLPIGSQVLDLDVHPIPASSNRPAHVHYDIRHIATTGEETLAIAADEVHDARWFTLEEALAAGVDDSLARALRKASELLQRE